MPRTAKFSLHIEGAAAAAHSVPVGVLVQVLENAQRAFELIGLFLEGREINKRARVPASVSKKYQLICDIPEHGCYAVPIRVGDPTGDLVVGHEIDLAWSKFSATFVAASQRNEEAIKIELPDTRLRSKVLEAFKGMAPKPGSVWRLELFDGADQHLARLDELSATFLHDIWISREEREATQTVTGELRSIDFMERKLTLLHPATKTILACFYDEAIEDVLYENRRQMIQVTGRVVLDERGQPKEIVEVSDIQDLDLSPFEIDRVMLGNVMLQAEPRLVFEPLLDEDKQSIRIEYPVLGILAFAATRDGLLKELHEQISMLWREYAGADDSQLTEDARDLKVALRSAFREAQDAA